MKAKPCPTRELAMRRLQQGASLKQISSETGVSEALLLELIGDAAQVQKPAKRKPMFAKGGRRLGRAALWS